MTAARALPDYLDARQVAAILRTTEAAVRKAVQRGQLTADGHGARGLALFLPATVDAYLRRRIGRRYSRVGLDEKRATMAAVVGRIGRGE